MAQPVSKHLDLYHALLNEGFKLPDECAGVHLVMPVDGVYQLEYKVNLHGERLAQVGRALAKMGESQS